MSNNPGQKAGNARSFKRKRPMKRSERLTRRIARQEANKVVKKAPESKIIDRVFQPATASWAGRLEELMLNVPAGTGQNQVLGGEFRPSHLRIKGVIGLQTGATSSSLVRIIVAQMTGTTALIPAANLLSSIGNQMTPTSPYDNSLKNLFTILHDEFYVLVPNTESNVATFDIRILSKKLKKVTCLNIGSGNITITSGNIAVYTYSSIDPAVPTDLPAVGWNSRMYFKDA